MVKKLMQVLLVLVLAITLSGCGSGPPDAIVEEAVLSDVGQVKEVKDIDIVNEYSRDVNGEELWTVEYEIEVVYTDSTAKLIDKVEDKFGGEVYLVHRGNSWYQVRN